MRRKIKTPSEDNLQRRIVYALYALYEHYGLDSMYRVIRHVVAFLPAVPADPTITYLDELDPCDCPGPPALECYEHPTPPGRATTIDGRTAYVVDDLAATLCWTCAEAQGYEHPGDCPQDVT